MSGTDVVWKFVVPFPDMDGNSRIDLPRSAWLLSAGIQDDRMVVWALVQDRLGARDDTRPHRIIAINSGQEVAPFGARFLGTCAAGNGNVWHVFDGGKA